MVADGGRRWLEFSTNFSDFINEQPLTFFSDFLKFSYFFLFIFTVSTYIFQQKKYAFPSSYSLSHQSLCVNQKKWSRKVRKSPNRKPPIPDNIYQEELKRCSKTWRQYYKIAHYMLIITQNVKTHVELHICTYASMTKNIHTAM